MDISEKRLNKYLKKNIKNISPSLKVLILGASGGIGKALSLLLAKYYQVNLILAGRNLDLLNEVKEEIIKENKIYQDNKEKIIDLLYIDFLDFKSVNKFINEINNNQLNFDILINNIGIYHQDIYYLKEIESKFNHLYDKTFLVNYLIPSYILYKTKDSLINKNIKLSFTSSLSYYFFKYDYKRKLNDNNKLLFYNSKNKTKRYALTKRLLNIYLISLKKENPDLAILITHPGIALTNLFDKKNKAYPKLFYIFIPPIMKIIFMSPKYASLSSLKSIDLLFDQSNNNDNNNLFLYSWLGPSLFFHTFYYPKLYLIKGIKKEEFYYSLKKLNEEYFIDLDNYFFKLK